MQQKTPRKRYFSFTLATTLLTVLVFGVIASCTDRQAKAKPNFQFKDSPKAGIVAKIGGEELTVGQLFEGDQAELYELKKREFDSYMDHINKKAVDKLIGAEAKKANLPLEDFITKKVVGGEIKISDKDFKKFVADKRIPESQINPQIKERINAYLQNQKKQDLVQNYVAKLTKSNPIEVYIKKPKMDIKVEVGQAPIYGKDSAKVTIVEFSDFQCPFCSRGAATLTEIKKKYGNKVKVAFKHFPLPMHKEAVPAAEASMCVNEQGTDKFWKFHDIAFKNQDKLDEASLEKYAKEAGADVKKWSDCYKGKKFAEFVKKDMEYGETIGVKSTPTFFINGQLVAGALPIESFAEIIDEDLEAN